MRCLRRDLDDAGAGVGSPGEGERDRDADGGGHEEGQHDRDHQPAGLRPLNGRRARDAGASVDLHFRVHAAHEVALHVAEEDVAPGREARRQVAARCPARPGTSEPGSVASTASSSTVRPSRRSGSAGSRPGR